MPATKYHVLLIGIDSYPVKPLHGCVNDIDAVQRLLLGRAEIPAQDITRLASPHPGTLHETTVPEQPATLANMRSALGRLGSDLVDSADRVFIYYSGHGCRAPVAGPQGQFFCESLVPSDVSDAPGEARLLADFEFNSLLAAIVKRTRSVALILDCCHSTGATRDALIGTDATHRVLDFAKDLPGRGPLQADAKTTDVEGRVGCVDDCQVVAACLNHELAQETLQAGMRHGLLTRALLTHLSLVENSEIRSVPWARIWQGIRASVEAANPTQHLWMSGSYARSVLAGPPVEGDAGFTLTKTGPNSYTIAAGLLADVNVGARLAVYYDKPPFFPVFGSADELAARVNKSLLRVVSAERAIAIAESESAPFELPQGARARLVQLGSAERLRCAIVPEDPKVVATLRASELLQLAGERDAQARLVEGKEGTWALTDDVNGAKAGSPALLILRPDQLDRSRQVLELYARYSLPIRMAGRCIDLPGQLQVKLLACPEDGLPEADANKADLPEVIQLPARGYTLEIGEGFCVSVRNASIRQLRVTLVNCAASGRVEFLGDQSIDARSSYRFWLNSSLGVPFVASKIKSMPWYTDRLVVIGTTLLDQNLSYLRNGARFQDILAPTRSTKDLSGVTEDSSSSAPVEKWTATEVMVRVGIPKDQDA